MDVVAATSSTAAKILRHAYAHGWRFVSFFVPTLIYFVSAMFLVMQGAVLGELREKGSTRLPVEGGHLDFHETGIPLPTELTSMCSVCSVSIVRLKAILSGETDSDISWHYVTNLIWWYVLLNHLNDPAYPLLNPITV